MSLHYFQIIVRYNSVKLKGEGWWHYRNDAMLRRSIAAFFNFYISSWRTNDIHKNIEKMSSYVELNTAYFLQTCLLGQTHKIYIVARWYQLGEEATSSVAQDSSYIDQGDFFQLIS